MNFMRTQSEIEQDLTQQGLVVGKALMRWYSAFESAICDRDVIVVHTEALKAANDKFSVLYEELKHKAER
jgi:hypothetical protein